ncbi:hypothetical protein FKM82_029038 [Ascaphus truei]
MWVSQPRFALGSYLNSSYWQKNGSFCIFLTYRLDCQSKSDNACKKKHLQAIFTFDNSLLNSYTCKISYKVHFTCAYRSY